MVEIDAVVMENVRLFLDKLRNAGILVSKAYIFGSYVSGKADKWSDIDIAVVSPQIGDDRFEERVRLTELAMSVDDRIDPLPFNQDTFIEGDPLVQKIVDEGLAVN